MPDSPQEDASITVPLKFLALEDRNRRLTGLYTDSVQQNVSGRLDHAGLLPPGSITSYPSGAPRTRASILLGVLVNISYQPFSHYGKQRTVVMVLAERQLRRELRQAGIANAAINAGAWPEWWSAVSKRLPICNHGAYLHSSPETWAIPPCAIRWIATVPLA